MQVGNHLSPLTISRQFCMHNQNLRKSSSSSSWGNHYDRCDQGLEIRLLCVNQTKGSKDRRKSIRDTFLKDRIVMPDELQMPRHNMSLKQGGQFAVLWQGTLEVLPFCKGNRPLQFSLELERSGLEAFGSWLECARFASRPFNVENDVIDKHSLNRCPNDTDS